MRTKTYSKEDFIKGLKKLCLHHNIISISGESGTGKTTLALFMVSNFLIDKRPYNDACVWIQAGERFPFRRLSQLFQDQKKELEYIIESIFVIPEDPIFTYEQQGALIERILDSNTVLPPNLRYIVIDNISHHLRFQLMQYTNVSDISSLLNTFYDTQLIPLILFCIRKGIVLILIHEVTFSLKDQCNRPFFYKLYNRIKTIDIVLSNIFNTKEKNLQITFNSSKLSFTYFIDKKGISIL
ncbi:MAG: AAA family ATPase [Promethearchaeota archaeon]